MLLRNLDCDCTQLQAPCITDYYVRISNLSAKIMGRLIAFDNTYHRKVAKFYVSVQLMPVMSHGFQHLSSMIYMQLTSTEALEYM